MTDDLRERVARAIAESDGYDHPQDWEDKLSECQREDYLANAAAALAEMGGVQNQLDEAINQLDSARHSVDVLERRLAQMGAVRVLLDWTETDRMKAWRATRDAPPEFAKWFCVALRAIAEGKDE